jgi:hypothetical protein
VCLFGVSELEKRWVERNPDAAFKVYVVWVPMLGAEEPNVPEATGLATDARVRHYWDGAGVLGAAYQSALGLSGPAWDVYLLFDQTATWHGSAPPTPAYWMHQLPGVASAPFLDPDLFAAKARALLGGR